MSHDGKVHEIDCPRDKYIMDVALEAGIDMPYVCKLGECGVCGAKVLSGKTSSSESYFLDNRLTKNGYILACKSFPKSDVTMEFESYKDENYFKIQPKK